MRRLGSLLAALLLLAACSAVGGGGTLLVEAHPPMLVLDNGTGQTVSYVAFEAETATMVDLAPVEEWATLARGRSLEIAYEDLSGYTAGDSLAVVYWSRGGRGGIEQVRVAL